MFQLILRPEAESDIEKVHAWYEKRRKGLGRDFVEELEKLFASIQEKPRLYPRAHKALRRALLKRFPYAIFYTLRSDEIVVSAVFHQSQDPGGTLKGLAGAGRRSRSQAASRSLRASLNVQGVSTKRHSIERFRDLQDPDRPSLARSDDLRRGDRPPFAAWIHAKRGDRPLLAPWTSTLTKSGPLILD